jgi:predicted amidohydrolase YtcJ
MTDLVLFNANVITLDPSNKKAGLVAIKNGRIQAVLSNDALKEFELEGVRLVDCRQRTLLPGFCDAHFHLWASASNQMSLDLSPGSNASSIPRMQAKIKVFSKNMAPGTWIRASGYNEFYLDEKRHPTSRDLDEAAPDNPVKLTHQSHHAHVLNSLALKQVGINGNTEEPPGGLIDRYTDSGEPNGILFGMSDFLSNRIPRISDNELAHELKTLNQKLLSLGITSIHDASSGNDLAQWQSFCTLKAKGYFLPRITMSLGFDGFLNSGCPGFADPDQLRISGVKIILSETTGKLYPSQEVLNRMVLRVHQKGMQVSIHAIEEAAVESACTAIEYALQKIPIMEHRHRIEHCSVCSPFLAKRIASLGIVVVSQPPFLYHNGDRYLKTIEDEEITRLYPFGTLQKMGVLVAGSSDSPVVSPEPLPGIYSAVFRRTETGERLSSKEGVDMMYAFKMYTVNAAKATFDEKVKGSISPGKLADMVLLNNDPTTLLPHKFKDLEVVMTVIGGDIVWTGEP